MNQTRANERVDHFFRHLSGQLMATLTRIFGPAHLELAENVIQDAFLKAVETWPVQGIPKKRIS